MSFNEDEYEKHCRKRAVANFSYKDENGQEVRFTSKIYSFEYEPVYGGGVKLTMPIEVCKKQVLTQAASGFIEDDKGELQNRSLFKKVTFTEWELTPEEFEAEKAAVAPK